METRVAAYGVIVRDGLLLMSHWREGARWTLPGGGLEPGEDPADAAVREILEETGYEAAIDGLLGIASVVIPAATRIRGSGDLHTLQFIFSAHVVSGSLRREADGSSDDARWVPLDEVDTLPHVSHVDFGLEKWRSRS